LPVTSAKSRTVSLCFLSHAARALIILTIYVVYK
jgi:hypothetical protein